MSNEKKVVIVTGASRGIGEALVEAYRGKDYRVVTDEILHVDGGQSAGR